MNRRTLLALAAAAILDPERLLWVPGKLISIPDDRPTTLLWSIGGAGTSHAGQLAYLHGWARRNSLRVVGEVSSSPALIEPAKALNSCHPSRILLAPEGMAVFLDSLKPLFHDYPDVAPLPRGQFGRAFTTDWYVAYEQGR